MTKISYSLLTLPLTLVQATVPNSSTNSVTSGLPTWITNYRMRHAGNHESNPSIANLQPPHTKYQAYRPQFPLDTQSSIWNLQTDDSACVSGIATFALPKPCAEDLSKTQLKDVEGFRLNGPFPDEGDLPASSETPNSPSDSGYGSISEVESLHGVLPSSIPGKEQELTKFHTGACLYAPWSKDPYLIFSPESPTAPVEESMGQFADVSHPVTPLPTYIGSHSPPRHSQRTIQDANNPNQVMLQASSARTPPLRRRPVSESNGTLSSQRPQSQDNPSRLQRPERTRGE